MKCLRLVLPAVMLLTLTAPVFAQTDAQKSFDTLKTLAGNWEGHVTLNPRSTKWTASPCGSHCA